MNIINHKNSIQLQLNSANVCKNCVKTTFIEQKLAKNRNQKKNQKSAFFVIERTQKKRSEIYSDRFCCFLFNCFQVCLQGKMHNIINAK